MGTRARRRKPLDFRRGGGIRPHVARPTTRVSGATTDEDDPTMAIVNLNSSGSGEIVYDVMTR